MVVASTIPEILILSQGTPPLTDEDAETIKGLLISEDGTVFYSNYMEILSDLKRDTYPTLGYIILDGGTPQRIEASAAATTTTTAQEV